MQNWFEEEYEATSFAEKYTPGKQRCKLWWIDADTHNIPDIDLKYHLQLHLHSLEKLGTTWQRKLPILILGGPCA